MKRRTHHLITRASEHLTLMPDALDDFLLALRAEHKSPRTLEFYAQNCRRFIAWCQEHGHPAAIQQIEASHVRGWLSDLQTQQHISDVSVQTYFRALRGWVNWCEREDLIDASPFRSGKLRCPKAKQQIKPTYSDADLHALLDACHPHSQNGYRDLAVILLLLDTGIRASELAGLALSDLERGRMRVLGKGNRERYVTLSPQTEKAIREYVRRERRGDGQSRLFLGAKGAMTRYGIYQLIEARAKQAGIDAKGVHMFRHTFALQWAKQGAPLHALQSILGHESPIMSLRYGRMATGDAQELHRQFSPVQNLGRKKRD